MSKRSASNGCGGGNRTRSFPAYEAGAFPPGSPAIEKLARRLGAAPNLRGFGDQAAQAGARRVCTRGVYIGKLERSAGFAPTSPERPSGILVLDDDRE
jgi:hypothetical protein